MIGFIKVSKAYSTPNTSAGMVLLALVGVIALLATMLFITYLNNGQIKIERDKTTQQALSMAKQALIGWSVMQNNPGRLPCPEDTSKIGESTEGEAAGACALPAMGRLPWKTLKLGDLRDGDGERLWYVVSPGYRTPPINTTVPGQLTVNGTHTAVAIIFSPGHALSGQVRTIPTKTNPPAVAQYLELSNNDGNNSFVTMTRSTSFNDQAVVVTSTDLFEKVILHVLSMIEGDASEGLVEYYQKYGVYPYADSADADLAADTSLLTGFPSADKYPDSMRFSGTTKNTLVDNQWLPLITYNVSANQQQVTLASGTITRWVHP